MRESTVAILSVILTVILLGVGGVATFKAKNENEILARIDKETLCPSDEGDIGAQTILLVDATEGLAGDFADPNSEKAKLLKLAMDERVRLSEGGRLTVLSVNDVHPDYPRQIFSMCKPLQPNFLTISDAQARSMFMGRFNRNIRDQLARAELSKAKQSPVMESLVAVAQMGSAPGRAPLHRLVVVSDMLQYMPGKGVSHLNQEKHKTLDFNAFSANPANAHLLPVLDGVDVVVYYQLHKQYWSLQDHIHRTFWEAYFRAAGAQVEWIGGGLSSLQAVGGRRPDAPPAPSIR